MTIERGLRLAAGVVVLVSLGLSLYLHPAWLLLTAVAGLNLLQSAITNWCPMVWILARMGLRPCEAGSQQKRRPILCPGRRD
jgi:hypothetical protein